MALSTMMSGQPLHSVPSVSRARVYAGLYPVQIFDLRGTVHIFYWTCLKLKNYQYTKKMFYL